jgi:site-specific DNA recombinase
MKQCFAYIRVSTAKQGEQGVSLQEQRDAISRYAERNNLIITSWFEERETAAKRGRPVFTRMLRQLKKGNATGVVIHKIDRSARNLRDWADLGDLIDYGIDVHFANESLDLHSRGGRLSADIQAVVAADYIRNLREETRKGFYGRLKQGLYPLPAPIGYFDEGRGKAKSIDPVRGPLVRKAFELYSTGAHNLKTLQQEMLRLGLRNRNGRELGRTALSTILNNPFYLGLMRLKRTSELFPGIHQPLVKKYVFDRVQAILRGKTNTTGYRHSFLFRRLLKCQFCGYSLIGELQKGRAYYRCHTPSCPTSCLREDSIDENIQHQIAPLQFSDQEKAYIQTRVTAMRLDWTKLQEEHTKALDLALNAIDNRLSRLTDAYLDQALNRELFEQKKTALLLEKQGLQERLQDLKHNPGALAERLVEFLELAGSAYLRYKLAIPEEKRDLLKDVTSNCSVDRKNVIVMLKKPFDEVAMRVNRTDGIPHRDIPRTWDPLILRLSEILSKQPAVPVISTRDDSTRSSIAT